MVEVLAPVGSSDMLEAALRAQADAVYLSGKMFGARAYANNFDLDQLRRIFDEVHLKNKRVYVTVNTLLSDEELVQALDYAYALYEAGADALIIQDLGLLKVLRQSLPQMSLHASTQVTLYDLEGVLWAKRMGFDRVVLARETSLDMIRKIRQAVDIELEVFVHGSLCISYSGNCLMSAHIGGRSGNRGRCAQPCRKKYRILDSKGKALGPADTYISPRDMMTVNRVEELKAAGIHSFKIEGRMKRPSYVYQAVRAYQNALAGNPVDLDMLQEVSKRAFTEGYLFNHFGKSILQLENTQRGTFVGVVEKSKTPFFRTIKPLFKGDSLSLQTGPGRRVPMTLTRAYDVGQSVALDSFKDALLGSKVLRLYSEQNERMEEEEAKLPISAFFTGRMGSPLQLTLLYSGEEVTVTSDVSPEMPKSRPISVANIEKQISRLGNTIYVLDHLEIDMPDPVFFPLSAIGALRREGVEVLNKQRLKPYYRKAPKQVVLSTSNPLPSKSRRVSLSLYRWENQIENHLLDQIDRIYLEDFSNIKDLRSRFSGSLYLKMPVVDTDQDRSRIKVLLESPHHGVDGIETENPGQAIWLRSIWKGPIHAGLHWNVFNGQALELLAQEGIASATLSSELSMVQIEKMRLSLETEVLAYGRLLSMTMRHCPASGIKGCLDDLACHQCPFKQGYVLQDEKGALFPFERRGSISYIWHHELMDGGPYLKRLAQSGVQLLRFEEGPSLNIALEACIPAWQEGVNIDPVTDARFTGHLSKGIE